MISAYYNSFRELSCVNEVLYSFRQYYVNNQIIFVILNSAKPSKKFNVLSDILTNN